MTTTTGRGDPVDDDQRGGLDARYALPLAAGGALFLLAWVPRWATAAGTPIPGWTIGVVGVVGVALAWWQGRSIWPPRVFGEALANHGRLFATSFAVMAGAWLVFAATTSPWSALPALAVGLVVFGGWFAVLESVAPRHADRHDASVGALALDDQDAAMRAILDRAQCADVHAYPAQDNRAGFTVPLGPAADADPIPTYADVQARMARIATNLAVQWRANGVTLDVRDVNLYLESLDRWNLVVSTKKVLRQTVPYVPDRSRSANDREPLGLYEVGDVMEVVAHGWHLLVVGATGGGKTVVENNIIGRGTETVDPDTGERDRLVWVCAVQKLIPFVYPWVEPWAKGDAAYPAIDMIVGEDPDDVREFLLRVYRFVVYRNRQLRRQSKHTATSARPAVTVIVEEAKALAGDRTPIEVEPGVEWTASRLLAETLSIARSAGVRFVLASQSGLFDSLGSHGSDIMGHLSVRICTRTNKTTDGTNTLPALPGYVDTTKIEDNAAYVQLGVEASSAMRWKAALLEEDGITPVAIENGRTAAVLEPGGVAAMNDAGMFVGDDDVARRVTDDYYQTRWSPDRLPELVAALADEGVGWPVTGDGAVSTGSAPRPAGVDVTPRAGEDEDMVAALDAYGRWSNVGARFVDDYRAGRLDPAVEGVARVLADDIRRQRAESAPAASGGTDTGTDDERDSDMTTWDDAARAFGIGDPPPPPRPTVSNMTAPAAPTTGDRERDRGMFGLPTGGHERLEEMARAMREPLVPDHVPDELAATAGATAAADASAGLPEPLRSVVRYVDDPQRGPHSWYPTETLAAAVFGDGVPDAARKLGRALASNVPGLTSTDPRTIPGGAKRRGYVVADLRRAAECVRAGRPFGAAE